MELTAFLEFVVFGAAILVVIKNNIKLKQKIKILVDKNYKLKHKIHFIERKIKNLEHNNGIRFDQFKREIDERATQIKKIILSIYHV